MTGSISVQFSLIAEDLFGSPAKVFIFFRDTSLRQGHIFKSKYLYCEAVRQMFQIVLAEVLSALYVEIFYAIATLLHKRGQSPISASS
jgi:hypothetical protein